MIGILQTLWGWFAGSDVEDSPGMCFGLIQSRDTCTASLVARDQCFASIESRDTCTAGVERL